ncbi:MAG: molybdopterin molybdenumtransferase MoeA [Alphaproteobacteria bacterium]|nr:molybdopterin molybdenumtransferase MoeA [Alphaproteobacteria bacterium]
MKPPTLKNDCFAMPAGVDWTPVDQALDLLRARLHPVVACERAEVAASLGRILAADIRALRANPPVANSAVDGFGFASDGLGKGVQILPLVAGRSAAGARFMGVVPNGYAVRILTGAAVPNGVDTVVMNEDTTFERDRIAFHNELKKGANTRKAGEDFNAGQTLFRAGHRISAADIAVITASGIAEIEVFARLKVGVLSTGDEICDAGTETDSDRIFDANRPMLLAILTRWGFEAVDLGHVGDDRAAVRARLDQAAETVDAMLTSGGASAGEEDHLSAIFKAEGQISSWRIALKPGRPLALGMWRETPVFGLPGNPVAAFVCTLIFARPALGLLAGAGWETPQGFDVKAEFAKDKKPGRREYLRARMNDQGRAEVYPSEGSGRISSLSWADGLVELADEAAQIQSGSLVKYYPFGSFGL